MNQVLFSLSPVGTIHLLGILGLLFVLFFIDPFYIKVKRSNHKTCSTILKALGTIICIFFAFLNFKHSNYSESTLILMGLILGLLGDIGLEFHIIFGGTFFFLGNLVYAYTLLKLGNLLFGTVSHCHEYIPKQLSYVSATYFGRTFARNRWF